MHNIFFMSSLTILLAFLLVLDKIKYGDFGGTDYEDYSCGKGFDKLCCPIRPKDNKTSRSKVIPGCFCKCGREPVFADGRPVSHGKPPKAEPPSEVVGRRRAQFTGEEEFQYYCNQDEAGWATTVAPTTTPIANTSAKNSKVQEG